MKYTHIETSRNKVVKLQLIQSPNMHCIPEDLSEWSGISLLELFFENVTSYNLELFFLIFNFYFLRNIQLVMLVFYNSSLERLSWGLSSSDSSSNLFPLVHNRLCKSAPPSSLRQLRTSTLCSRQTSKFLLRNHLQPWRIIIWSKITRYKLDRV